LGIENVIVKKYGRAYWEKHKWEILKKAGKHYNLQQAREFPNAQEVRYMKRHVEDYGFALFWLFVEGSML
jgi:hypothetical protein